MFGIRHNIVSYGKIITTKYSCNSMNRVLDPGTESYRFKSYQVYIKFKFIQIIYICSEY